MRNFYLSIIVLALSFFVTATLLAEEAKNKTKNAVSIVEDNGEIVITATRTPEILNNIGGSTVEVITAEEIENSVEKPINEIISSISGVSVVSSGGLGANTSIFIRGGDSKDLLILLDGVVLNDPSTPNRSSDISNLTTDDIERIELIKGSQSVLYGSNATSGVLNIITKKGKKKPEHFVKIGAGSYNTQKMSLGSSGKFDSLNYSLNLSKTITDGFSASNSRNDRIPQDGNTDENDGWQNQTATLNLGYEINKNFDIQLIIKDVKTIVETDDFNGSYSGDYFYYDSATYSFKADPTAAKNQYNSYDHQLYSLKIHNLFFDGAFESTFSTNNNQTKRKYFDNEKVNNYNSDGVVSENFWQGSFMPLDSHEITLGFGQFKENMTQESIWDSVSTIDKYQDVKTDSYWLQDKIMLLDENFVIVLGGRNDKHQLFGSTISNRISPSFYLTATKTKFKSSYANGFRSPSLYELYSFYLDWFTGEPVETGNKNLTPEKSQTLDYGFEQELFNKKVILDLTFFKNSFENKIDYIYDETTFIPKYQNVDGVTTAGGYEVKIDYLVTDKIKFKILNNHIITKDPDGNSLTRRPIDSTNLSLNTKFNQSTVAKLEVSQIGARKTISGVTDKDGNTVYELAAYSLVNLSASKRFNDMFKLSLRIDNLFDEVYEDAWSYQKPGRSFYVGLKTIF